MNLTQMKYDLSRYRNIFVLMGVILATGGGLYTDISLRHQTSFENIEAYRAQAMIKMDNFAMSSSEFRYQIDIEIDNKDEIKFYLRDNQAMNKSSATVKEIMTKLVNKESTQVILKKAYDVDIVQSEWKYVVLANLLNPMIAEQLVAEKSKIEVKLVQKEGIMDLTFIKYVNNREFKRFTLKQIRLGEYHYFLL